MVFWRARLALCREMALVLHHPFTRRQALEAGITDAQLRAKRFRQLFHGVYISTSVEMTLLLWLRAALLVSPADAIVSHVTALRLYGLEVGKLHPLHISTRTRTHARRDGIRPHQRIAPIAMRTRRGIPVTSPLRTMVDIATKITTVELIQAAEHMAHKGLLTLDELGEYAVERHLDGVVRLRRALGWMREGVESPLETTLRLMLVFAHLPEPRCNHTIRDASGRFIARGDLVYVSLRIVIEYDGWHHERDGAQRQHDLVRRERLEAEGWRVIVVTSEDLKEPQSVVWRIHAAMTARGYVGARPRFSIMWTKWFPTEDPLQGASGLPGLAMSA